MADLEILARRAGEAARTEARARGRGMAPPGPRSAPSLGRRPVLAGLAVLVVVVALALVGGRLLVDPGLVIEPVGPVQEPDTLPVPEVGSVAPGYLADGTPVFVSHPEDGTLLVLDATSPHQDNKLVAYCVSSGLFEDLYHGSRFTGWGDWVAGPSPTGLRVHPHELLAGGRRVLVTGPAGEGNERTQPRGPDDVGPQGPACEPGYDDLSNAVGHRPRVEPRVLDGADITSERWVWASLVTGGTLDDPKVCDADGTCPAHAPSALPKPGASDIADQFLEPTVGVWFARATGDGAVQLRRPALPIDGPVEQWPEGVLPVPASGEVLAAYGWQQHPLFVVTDQGGSTLVLDATSPRHPTDLLGWCPGQGHFMDGSGVRYDRSGQAIDTGAPMHRYDHAASDVGRGDLRALRLLWGTGGWQEPSFVPESVPRATPQVAPCAQIVAHVPRRGDIKEISSSRFDTIHSWLWVQTTVREIDGTLRLCLGSETCEDTDLIIVSEGAELLDWPETPQLLYVRGDDSGRGEDSIDGSDDPHDHAPYRVHLRRPLLPAGQ